MRSEVFKLGVALQATLRGPTSLYTVGKRLTVGVRGKLGLPDGKATVTDSADCSFQISPTWRLFPPRVECHEGWFRDHTVDWHSYQEGGVCYEFPVFWKARLEEFEARNGPDPTLQLAANWCVAGLRNLLPKHLLADRLGLKNWPNIWVAWPHGYQAATRVYERVS